MKRPFKILGIQQVALGSLDKTPLLRLWCDLLGVERVDSFTSEQENVNEDILAVGRAPYQVEIDLMEPIDHTRKPSVHSPALNHIGLWVDNIREAYNWLQEQKVRFTHGGIRPGASGHDVCFIHPKGNEEYPLSGEGVLIELIQHPENVGFSISK